MSEPWYRSAAPEEPLTQGDLIQSCPIVGWRASAQLDFARRAEIPAVDELLEVQRVDVIVMTQACDLEHSKVRNVVLCPVYPLGTYKTAWEASLARKGQNPTTKAWIRYCEDLRDGAIWNSSLLNSTSSVDIQLEHGVVDFHEVFTLPREVVESLLKSRGKARPRLLPPYREHLSQAFARFFMRVGLPTPVERCW